MDRETDRHRIWRIVKSNVTALKEHAPEGYQAVVDVYLSGRPGPIRLNEVQTNRDPDFAWTLFIQGEGPDPSPEDRLVFGPEHTVERIEVYYEPAGGRPMDFILGLLEDPPAGGAK